MFWNRIAAASTRSTLFLAIVFVATPLLAQSTLENRSASDKVTFQLLEEHVIDADYFEKRAEDILASLTTETGLTFVLDESAADNSLDHETLITRKLPNIRLATFLEMILEEFQCTWTIKDGIVVIVSQDAALDIGNMSVMVFECADLIEKIKPRTETRRDHGHGIGARVGNPGRSGRGGGGVFSVGLEIQEDATEPTNHSDSETESVEEPPKTPPTTPDVYEVTISGRDQLVNLISDTVDPDSWEFNGGNARIHTLNNLVVILQTHQNLRSVNDFLGQLRSARLGD